MTQVIFICTGNIFRSMTAEFALRALIERERDLASRIQVGSAGIEAKPQTVHPLVIERLRHHGLDVSGHQQRKLSRELLAPTALCLAMGRDHQTFINETFAVQVPLFNEKLFGRDEPVLDVWEAVPDWQTNKIAAGVHTIAVVDYLITSMPTLLEQLKAEA